MNFMRNKINNQVGFIPMIVIFLLLISAAIWLVYTRVISAHP